LTIFRLLLFAVLLSFLSLKFICCQWHWKEFNVSVFCRHAFVFCTSVIILYLLRTFIYGMSFLQILYRTVEVETVWMGLSGDMASRHVVWISPFTMVQHFWWFLEPVLWTDAIKCTFGNLKHGYRCLQLRSYISASALKVHKLCATMHQGRYLERNQSCRGHAICAYSVNCWPSGNYGVREEHGK